jgi:dephospho-CoA kinase
MQIFHPEDPFLGERTKQVEIQLAQLLVIPQLWIKKVEEFSEIINIDSDTFVKQLTKMKRNFDYIKKSLFRLKDQLDEFEHVFFADTLYLGIFVLDC